MDVKHQNINDLSEQYDILELHVQAREDSVIYVVTYIDIYDPVLTLFCRESEIEYTLISDLQSSDGTTC